MEEKSILDSVYKVCICCGQKRTLRNYRLLPRAEFGNELVTISDKFSQVCKCCEKHPEKQLKKNRIESLREKMARFKANAVTREKKEREKAYRDELEELGLYGYVPYKR